MTIDDELLSALRTVLDRVDVEPAHSRELAYGAMEWRDIDAQLAELVFDSAYDKAEAVVRSADDNIRTLTFSTAEVSIEIEVSRGRLIGQVIPPAATTVELVQPNGDVLAKSVSDELGVFTIDEVPAGPTSLVCRALDGSWSIRTAWTSS